MWDVGALGRFNSSLQTGQVIFQSIALGVFALFALAMVSFSTLAAFGTMSWIDVTMMWQGQPVQNAGMVLQISLTILAVSLCFFLPTNRRVLALERSHRRFNVTMQDVTQAYQHVHAADREGVFTYGSEFDAMKDRLAYLKDHPDLMDLEHPVLELAAQMSFISKELADVYSDKNVDRARMFLKQRQEEVDRFNERLHHAKAISEELKHQLHEVKLDEQLASAQLDELCEDLMSTLPELGLDGERPKEFRLVDIHA